MVVYKTDEEIQLIKQSCMLVCQTLSHVGSLIKPGITGEYLDKQADTFIRDHNAVPAFKGYRGFPGTLCISFNEQVVHGIPSKKEIVDGDIISIDCGVYANGYFGDSAFTFAVGEISDEVMNLLQVTNTSLYMAIDQAVAGKRIGDISFAVQNYCEKKHRYGVVRELVGHGIGKELHEPPEVPNYGKRGKGTKLKEGLVIAIEPMVNLGKKEVRTQKDGWTITTKDKKVSAHYEHTIAVKKDKAEVLSDHTIIEEEIKKNEALNSIGVLAYA